MHGCFASCRRRPFPPGNHPRRTRNPPISKAKSSRGLAHVQPRAFGDVPNAQERHQTMPQMWHGHHKIGRMRADVVYVVQHRLFLADGRNSRQSTHSQPSLLRMATKSRYRRRFSRTPFRFYQHQPGLLQRGWSSSPTSELGERSTRKPKAAQHRHANQFSSCAVSAPIFSHGRSHRSLLQLCPRTYVLGILHRYVAESRRTNRYAHS